MKGKKMTYEQALDYVFSKNFFGVKPSLERIEKVLEKIGNPQNKLKFVHVAGTNGKGTTCTYISQILNESGYKVGLYTSPFIENFTERIRICGVEIDENELAKQVEFLKNIEENSLTQFEFITALAFNYFAQENCDIVVLEVGLGGKFDATNVIKNPLACAIMSISLDHTAVLGDNISQIALEKGGIIKENSPVVFYPNQNESKEIIEKICKEKNATLIKSQDNANIISQDLFGSEFEVDNTKIFIPFCGKHQVLNALVAFNVIKILQKYFIITEEHIINGFKNSNITARMQIISKNPLIILDGGHNPDCANALKNMLKTHCKDKKITAIIGISNDKDSNDYIKILAPCFQKIIATQFENPRAMKAEELCKIAKKYCENSSFESFPQRAVESVENFDVLVICGSMFLAGEILSKYNSSNSTNSIDKLLQ